MRNWLRRRWVIGLGSVALLLGLVLILLLVTPLGLRLGLALAPPELEIESVEGSLLTGFAATNLVYRAPTADVEIERVRIDWAPGALFGATVHVELVDVGRLLLRLKPAPGEVTEPATEAGAFEFPDLRLPIDLRLDRLSVAAISVEEIVDEETVVHVDLDGIELADLAFVDADLSLGELAMANADASVALGGRALLAAPFATDLRLTGAIADELSIGAAVVGDAELLTVEVDTSGIVETDLDLNLTALLREAGFSLNLTLAVDDLARFAPDAPIEALSLSFDAGGSADSVAATSVVSLPGITDLAITQDVDLDLARGQIDINRFEIAEVDLPGRLSAEGLVSIDPDRPSRLALTWSDLSRIRLDAAGLHTESGQVELNGTVDDLEIDLAFDFSSEYGDGQVNGRVFAQPETVVVERLEVAALEGTAVLTATASYGDAVAAEGTLTARALDLTPHLGQPTVFGLDATFDLEQPADGELNGALRLVDIAGSVAGREIDGSGRLGIQGERYDFDDFSVRLGDNRLSLDGEWGDTLTVDAIVDAPDLSQIQPGLSGRLSGAVNASGTPAQPKARARLAGQELGFADVLLAELEVDANVDLLGGDALAVSATLAGLESGDQIIDAVEFSVDGTQARHEGQLDVTAALGTLAIGWGGGLVDASYSGELSVLTVTPADFEPLQLAAPVPFRASADAQALDAPLCLTTFGSELCLSVARDADALSAGVRLDEVDLEQFQPFVDRFAPEPAALAGRLSGSASFNSSADGSDWSGTAAIESASTTLTIRRQETDIVLGHEGLRLDADVSPDRIDVDLAAQLIPEASIEARVTGGKLEASAPLGGTLTIDVPEFAAFGPLAPQVSDLEGRARVEAEFGGTIDAPEVVVNSSVEGLEAFLTELGLQLSDGFARLTVNEGGAGEIEAALSSGDGRIEISSAFAADDGQAELRVQGENFLGMDTEEIRALVSPDLTITVAPELLSIRGTVDVPTLEVDLTAFEGSVSGSPDVVVVGRDQQAKQASQDLDVTLRLGDGVVLSGFGVDGQLTGSVRARQRPGQAMLCTGQINIAGGLSAYGQDLQVDRGRLLFAGVACENPVLDIVAERELDDMDATVGVRVAGTAAFPTLTVFSNPAREESEALCMLVTGGSCSSDSGDAVEDAILAAGLGASSAVTNRIGQQAGLDELSLTSSEEFEGAGFTMGKQIAPRMRVSYGRSFSNNVQYFEFAYEVTRLLEVSVRQALETITSIRYRVELD
ncbi:MAG: translocation/assembly module TamB domain-containing protein [Pseudomonadota bacterium]